MTFSTLLVGLLVVSLGSSVQSLIGFGAALTSVPLLLLINPDLVPGPFIVAGLALNVTLLVAHRREADWAGARWAVLGLLPGTALAAVALSQLESGSLAVLSALAVLAAVAVTAIGRLPQRGPRVLLGAGFFSGYMATTAGVGGPPLALAYREAGPPTVRGTLPVVFLAGAGLSLFTLGQTDHLHTADVWAGLAMAPGGAIGFLATRRLVRFVDGNRMRSAVLWLSALSGLAALLRALL